MISVKAIHQAIEVIDNVKRFREGNSDIACFVDFAIDKTCAIMESPIKANTVELLDNSIEHDEIDSDLDFELRSRFYLYVMRELLTKAKDEYVDCQQNHPDEKSRFNRLWDQVDFSQMTLRDYLFGEYQLELAQRSNDMTENTEEIHVMTGVRIKVEEGEFRTSNNPTEHSVKCAEEDLIDNLHPSVFGWEDCMISYDVITSLQKLNEAIEVL